MVTRVEVGSLTSLTGVPGLGEITKEETLKCTYFLQVSDPSGASSEPLLEGKSPFRSPARLLPLPTLAPKPFSLGLKSPATSLGPGQPFSPCGLSQDKGTASLGEKMPSLVEQESGTREGLRRSSSLFNRAEFLRSGPNTMIPFEEFSSPKLGPALGKGAREASVAVSQEPSAAYRPEVAPKPTLPARKPGGVLPWPASLSQDARPTAAQEGMGSKESPAKSSSTEDTEGPPVEPRPCLKRRPVSAIFIESIQSQKSGSGGTATAGKTPPTPPEKTWVRKPRPLSVDLTAQFENRGEALLKKGAPEVTAISAPQHWRLERSEPEPRVDRECLVKAETPPQDLDSGFLELAKKNREPKEQMLFKQAEMDGLRDAGDSVRVPPTEDQNLGKEKAKLDRELEKAPKGPSSRPGKGQEFAELNSRVTDRETLPGREWPSQSSSKKRASQQEEECGVVSAPGSEPSRVTPEFPLATAVAEKPGMSVQERIKGWTAESSEARPETSRKLFQARPLSADLTKLGSGLGFRCPGEAAEVWGEVLLPCRYPGSGSSISLSPILSALAREASCPVTDGPGKLVSECGLEGAPASGHTSNLDLCTRFLSSASGREVKYEKCSELNNEPRDKQKERHGLDGAPSPARPWKPASLREKPRQTEWKDSCAHVSGNCGVDSSAGALSPSDVTAPDDCGFQTVRATLFEHHVERHTVATPPGNTAAARLWEARPRPKRGSWPGKDAPEKTDFKREHSRWLENPDPETWAPSAPSNGEPRQHRMPLLERYPSGDRHSHGPFLKRSENPPASQRAEPHLDSRRALGEGASSEASWALKGKALAAGSCSSRRSLRARQLSLESVAFDPECRPEGPVQRASSMWEARGAHEVSPKPDFREPKDTLGSGCQPPKWSGGVTVSRHKAPMLVSEEKGRAPSPEVARELSGRPCDREAILARAVQAAVRETPREAPEGVIAAGERGDPPGYPLGAPPRAEDALSDFRARPHPDMPGQTSALAAAVCTGEPRPGPPPLPETRLRRASPSDQRVDRWRRRTLPHDVKFDEFSILAPQQSPKAERGETDYLTSPDTGALRKPQLSHNGVPAQEGSPGALQDLTLPAVKLGSSVEPKATFFAVTYQIPDSQKSKSIVKPGPPNGTEPLRSTAPPPSPRSSASPSASLHHKEPLESRGSKNWAKDRQHDDVSFSKTHHRLSLGDRILDPASEKISADALWHPRAQEDGAGAQNCWKDSGSRTVPSSAPQVTPAFRSRQKSGDLVRRRTEVVSETFPGKSRDGYRSSVLDLDALMEEYKRQPTRDPEEAWEGPASDRSPSCPDGQGQRGGMGQSRRRSLREVCEAEGPWKRASVAETNQTSSAAQNTTEPPRNTAPPPYPRAGISTKGGPLWAVPPSASEKHPVASSGSEGPWKKVVGAAEDEHEAFVSKHRGGKRLNYPAESQPTAPEDPGSGAGISLMASPTEQKKGTPRTLGKEEQGSVAQWRGHPHGHGRSLLEVKRTYSEKSAPPRIREELSLMQEVREKRRGQPRGRLGLSVESSEDKETKTGPSQRAPGIRDHQKVSLKAVWATSAKPVPVGRVSNSEPVQARWAWG
ncbi:hypothetical protein J0S82_003956 [Galemys pyrenaicus]|uniref:Tankyrase 1-binding protein C-terminal domain-containing protein n=1 Tax=Galemys pyrenaicus TaxID=202257 RepID=A0A8J6DPC3_GALPY|nr:hypothetical protein J0S82_003956 [Galemys pyrenaicus]